MTLQTLGAISVAALCAGMLWNAIRRVYTVYQIRAGKALQSVRVPDTPVPEHLTTLATTIKGLGFVPKLKLQQTFAGRRKPTEVWIYEHPELNIELGLAESPAEPPFWISLESNFADGALLATFYPHGWSVDTPEVKVHFASYSLQEAFDHHLMTQLAWTELHGDVKPLEKDETAFLAAGAEVAKRHSAVLYAPSFKQDIGQAIAMIGYILILLGFATHLLTDAAFLSFNLLSLITLFILVGLALAVGGNGWARRGKTIPAVDADKAPAIDPNVHPLNRPVRTS
jgi:hypothetical protein